jgi:hypothetical protein
MQKTFTPSLGVKCGILPREVLNQKDSEMCGTRSKDKKRTSIKEVGDELSRKNELGAEVAAKRLSGGGGEGGGGGASFVNDLQRVFFAALNSYKDFVMPCRPYPTDIQVCVLQMYSTDVKV